jgi:hypothetical protein
MNVIQTDTLALAPGGKTGQDIATNGRRVYSPITQHFAVTDIEVADLPPKIIKHLRSEASEVPDITLDEILMRNAYIGSSRQPFGILSSAAAGAQQGEQDQQWKLPSAHEPGIFECWFPGQGSSEPARSSGLSGVISR